MNDKRDGRPPTADNRTEPRRKIVRAAVAEFNAPPIAVPCVVLDLSRRGARLNIHHPTAPGDTFRLTIEAEKLVRTCRIIWHRGDEIGVRFDDPDNPT